MVAVILDFDSTITEASTLMQIYLRLPEEIFKQAAVISEKNYYNKELPLTKKCYTQIKNIINNEEEWEKCLKYITAEVISYSKEIVSLEKEGMNLIETPLCYLEYSGLQRAASQIKRRDGFNVFLDNFPKSSIYVISCNWSKSLIQLVCPEIPYKNIIANELIFKNGKCKGFDRKNVILTPEDKIRAYKKIQKPEVLYAGDSLPDLLPILNASKGFAFISHDKDFIEVCNKIKEKFSKEIFLVQNFQEVNNIIK